jgi:ABC-type dipeptide/oligopeptide/nickel transport system permease component
MDMHTGSMLRFLGVRTAALVPQLLAVSLVAFFLIRLAPGNPAVVLLGPNRTEEGLRQLEAEMGLNKSLPTQYWIYLVGVVHGNLGRSWFTGQSVRQDIQDRLPATLELIGYSMLLAACVGVGLGAVAAMRSGSWVTRILTGVIRLTGAFPDFWIALLAIFLFFHILNWVPAPTGRLGFADTPPKHITGLYTVDSLLNGDLAGFRASASHLILPVCILGVLVGLVVARVMLASMTTVVSSDFMRHARACGVSQFTLYRYAIRNALGPVITVGGVLFAYLLGGAVLIEQVFSWGGIGQYAVQAVNNADYAAIQGFLLVAAAFTILVYIAVDVLHMLVDPRVAVGRE